MPSALREIYFWFTGLTDDALTLRTVVVPLNDCGLWLVQVIHPEDLELASIQDTSLIVRSL